MKPDGFRAFRLAAVHHQARTFQNPSAPRPGRRLRGKVLHEAPALSIQIPFRPLLPMCRQMGQIQVPFGSRSTRKSMAQRVSRVTASVLDDIERRFGIGKRCCSLGRITVKLKHISEIMIHMSVLTLNFQKRLRLLLRFLFAFLKRLQVS